MADSGAGSVFTSITTVFRLVDFAVALKEVSSENRAFITLIQRVREDVVEALRLRKLSTISTHLTGVPGKKAWVDGAITDIHRSLNDIGLYVEGTRIDGESHGGAKMKQRFEWVLSHHQKLIAKELSLRTCHRSLMGAINSMQTIESTGEDGGGGSFEAPGLPPPSYRSRTSLLEVEEEILKSPFARKRAIKASIKEVPSVTTREIQPENENFPEPLTIMSVAMPATPLKLEEPNPNLNPRGTSLRLRGTSGYFPSLPVLNQGKAVYHELPGSTEFPPPKQKSPELAYRPIVRKPVPSVPRDESLAPEVVPWEAVRSEGVSKATTEAISEVRQDNATTNTIADSIRKSATQERRRKAQARRFAAAYGD